jgi:predicted TIM-barrel fold metal-dependent hydrolase
MTIDVQVHIFRRAMGVEPPPLAERLLEQMDAARVDKAILISYEGKDILPDLNYDPNLIDVDTEYYRQAAARWPERLIWFCNSIDPSQPYLEQVEYNLQRGAQGIKLFPAYIGTRPDDPRYDPLYELCRERNLPIIMAFERWNDPNLKACLHDYREFLGHFEGVASRYPEVQFLLTHWGCFSWGEQAEHHRQAPFPLLEPLGELLDRQANLSTDIAAIQFAFSPAAQAQLLQALVARLGAERVMYGTDWPWGGKASEMTKTVEFVAAAPFLGEKEKELILGGNAARFLGLG